MKKVKITSRLKQGQPPVRADHFKTTVQTIVAGRRETRREPTTELVAHNDCASILRLLAGKGRAGRVINVNCNAVGRV